VIPNKYCLLCPLQSVQEASTIFCQELAMFKYLKEYRFYIFLFLFVLIPVVSIDTATRKPRDYRFYDRVVVALTSPIQVAISWTRESVVSAFQYDIYRQDTRQNYLAFL